ncbi:hypothetical protein BDL97_01G112900 [Sphagnum fallax]|nr:hypothetical protein BDL97_01G112900 [Sphagnum fallax]
MKACLVDTVRVNYYLQALLACCLSFSVCFSHCGCPPGWQEGYKENVCLSLMMNANTWNDSENACKENGGHLASLNSVAEYKYVQSICSSGTTGGCWVGGEEAESGTGWSWSNCQALHDNDLSWVPKLTPANCSDPKHCLDLRLCLVVTNSLVLWEFCNARHSYLCSIGQDQECQKKAAGKEYTIILAVVSTVIFITTGGVVTFLLTYRCSKRQRRSRRRKLASLSSASGLVTPAFRLYTISELENATDHFSEANLLGQNQPDGGTYKGILLDGTEIAVKILVLSGIQSQKEFVHDMARIARIRHPNVVVLKGCCYDGGRGFAVYEFVSNGSLDKWLHNLTSEAHPLSWVERVRIATTVARGIAYLHHTLKPHVLHRDIRASNVLLDETFNAKILGVGLGRTFLFETARRHLAATGMFGYIMVAPELVYRNELTTKSDVYSFGVLLLEMITGRNPTLESESPDWQSMFEWATRLVQSQRFVELLDPVIPTVPDVCQIQVLMEMFYSCTQPVPAMRPRMSFVVHQLEQLREGVPLAPSLNNSTLGDNITAFDLEIGE